MRKRNFIHTRGELLEKGREIISSSAENKYIFRAVMVNLLLSGKISAAELSRLSEVPERTLRTWVRIADEEGFGRLRALKQTGRPERLTEQQKAEIKEALMSPPGSSGLRARDGPSLSEYIAEKYGLTYGVRQCQRLIKSLGF